MDRQKLTAQKRAIIGRKVKSLRKDGILPATVYGKDVASLAIQIPTKEFTKVYAVVGETGLVDLQVEAEVKPVLVANVQLHPVTDRPLHIDFRQVNLREKVQAAVPVELVGESPVEKSGTGILVQQLKELEIEALPTDLPEKVVADVSNLVAVDQAILVKDLSVNPKVVVLTDREHIVAKVEPPAKEEEVAPPPPTEGEEGMAPPAEGEGEAPVESKGEEAAPEQEGGEEKNKE